MPAEAIRNLPLKRCVLGTGNRIPELDLGGAISTFLRADAHDTLPLRMPANVDGRLLVPEVGERRLGTRRLRDFHGPVIACRGEPFAVGSPIDIGDGPAAVAGVV